MSGASELVERAWRCFHCDDVFTSERCAAAHFGRDESCEPACRIKAGAEGSLVVALRRAEKDAADAWAAIHNETTDSAKAYHAQASRHHEQLRITEELGYERGLADGRELSADELSRLSSAHSEADELARKHLAELAASRAEVVGLREALEEAARRFEGLSHIHDGNPSDAMADTPPLDYARHMLWEARRECREAAREARAALAGEKPVGAGVETLATDYLRGKIGEIIALQLDIEGGRAVEQAVEQILAVAALSKSGEKP